MNPVSIQKELKYINKVNQNLVDESDNEIKQQCDEKLIQWMKVSFQNKKLDMKY